MVVLNIQGMSCGHCTAAVEKALKAIPGVQSVEVTINPGQARVEGASDAAPLIAAVVAEGYSAQAAE